MNIIINGKSMSFSDFLYKVFMYLPKKIMWKIHDNIIKKRMLHIMNHGASDRETKILKKYLVRTLRNAYKNISYYQQFDFLKNVTKENVFELLAQLPILDKDIILSQRNNMINKKINIDYCGKGYTGGTTGQPFEFYYGRPEENSHQRAFINYITGENCDKLLKKRGYMVVFGGIRPSKDKIKKKIYWTDIDSNIYGSVCFCTLYMQEDNLRFYVEELNKLKPVIIKGYSNAVLNFAHFLELHDELELNIPLKAIYITSEHISKEDIIYMSKVYNCPVFGQYGQNEACSFSWTEANDDIYYCSPYYGYVEVVDDKGIQVQCGECGDVVVTAFGNDVMPFIRYRLGDRACYGGTENGIVKLKKLLGRNNEYIINLKKKKIYLSGWIDVHYLQCKDKIVCYQIQQDEIGKVIFRLVVNDSWNVYDENEISKLLAIENIIAEFEYITAIPMTKRGKQKRMIQNVII